MDEKIAIETLQLLKDLFDKHNIEFWLNYGTLLGAVRDKRFIRWDNDIDLSTWNINRDKLEILAKELDKKGFETGLFRTGLLIRKKKSQICVDVYIYRLDKNKAIIEGIEFSNYFAKMLHHLVMVNLTTQYISPNFLKDKKTKIMHQILINISDCYKNIFFQISYKLFKFLGSFYFRKEIPSNYLTKLSTIDFYGMKFKIPGNVEGYLKFIYGPLWKTPDKKWLHHL